MFWKSFSNYRVAYSQLWQTYGQSRLVLLSFVMNFVAQVSKLVALPIMISIIITKLSNGDFDAAQQAVLGFAAFSLLIGILSPLTKYVGMLGEQKVYHGSAAHYFKKLIQSDVEYFNSNLSGYLTTATRQYVDSCILFMRAFRDKYLERLLSILLPLLVIAWVDHVLGLVALLLSVLQATYLLWASHTVAPYRTVTREFYKKNSGLMSDFISNITAVKSAAQEEAATAKVGEGMAKENRSFFRRYVIQAKLTGVREAITVSFFLLLFWLTVQRMSSGAIELTSAVLVVTYAMTILTAIYSLSDSLDEHDDFVDKIIPALDVLERKNVITDPARPKKLGKVNGEITFMNVGFGYGKGSAVFDDFTLTIPPGQKVGVVGLSGAGKSTLIKLLLRFDDVQSGNVSVDGVDVRAVRQADLRRNVSYVPQEPLLFHASIRENVLLTRPHASAKEVERALKAANIWQFIQQLPDGMDSVVGERGVKLSGGQKQRIAIARAVLQNAPIMVLDEATSALDSESEQIIKASFADILRGRTAIVVAHRLSTLSDMDRIIVIDQGKLVEDGTHHSLLAKKGVYARLWNRQQKHLDADELTSVNSLPQEV